jgi:ABC-type transport system involved in multi-copper enzyme maturation permease subunit
MNTSQWAQLFAIVRLEIWKTFFSRRGLWIYLFALAPVLLFAANSIYAPRDQARLAAIAKSHPVALADLTAITRGMSNSVVVAKLGEPYWQHAWRHRADRGRVFEHAMYKYTDGKSDFTFHFFNGILRRIERSNPETLPENLLVFATIFRFYFLRLAVFFGCVGIFTNLFRGEMLDKSLHFYLLTPVRREILLAGKYLAGLLAAVVIFTASVALQWAAMLWQFPHDAAAAYFAGSSAAHLPAYLGVTALASAAYGSVFLCAGILFRNPIVPAAVVLLWESANLFLPATLQKFGIIYYLQSLCPLAAAPDSSMPAPLTLLISSASSASVPAALACLILFTLALLMFSAIRSRTLEINYSTD